MSTHRVELRLRVDPEVFAVLEQRAAAAGIASAPGRAGGAAEYVRRLVLDHLGLPHQADPHAQQSAERRQPVMLDRFNYRCGNGYAQVPAGSPALRELAEAGYPVADYKPMMGSDLPGRRRFILVPLKHWDELAAKQRGHAERPFRLPTEGDMYEDPIEGPRRLN